MYMLLVKRQPDTPSMERHISIIAETQLVSRASKYLKIVVHSLDSRTMDGDQHNIHED